jgi:hypothetical protein
MKKSVILAHPDRNSFNNAIAQTAVEQLSLPRFYTPTSVSARVRCPTRDL